MLALQNMIFKNFLEGVCKRDKYSHARVLIDSILSSNFEKALEELSKTEDIILYAENNNLSLKTLVTVYHSALSYVLELYNYECNFKDI